MQLITGSNCLIAALSMVTEIPNIQLEQIFPNFNEKLWDVPEPFCLRGVHVAEIQALMFFEFNQLFATVEKNPTIGCHMLDQPVVEIWNKASKDFIFYSIIAKNVGILLGSRDNLPHAVAWDGLKIYDPQGEIYSLDDNKFNIEEALIIV